MSTSTQADHGISLDAQQAKLTASAQLSVLELTEVLMEAGGGAMTVEQPGFQGALREWSVAAGPGSQCLGVGAGSWSACEQPGA